MRPEDPYFRFIGNDPSGKVGCSRSCDNLGHSLIMKQHMDRLTLWQKGILGGIAFVFRSGRSIGEKVGPDRCIYPNRAIGERHGHKC